ncbi:MAG: MerR family transcriptional regulator [Coriobacteriia bacterium]|nr:MerR family transcriptional regulator [Coriobacteriia bacterium]
MTHTVGQVARLAHVSVRTLHHYDEIGLLKPSARSDAGYRLYTLHCSGNGTSSPSRHFGWRRCSHSSTDR